MDEVFTYRLNMDYQGIRDVFTLGGVSSVPATLAIKDIAIAMNHTIPHVIKSITDINIRANQQDMPMPFIWSVSGAYVTLNV